MAETPPEFVDREMCFVLEESGSRLLQSLSRGKAASKSVTSFLRDVIKDQKALHKDAERELAQARLKGTADKVTPFNDECMVLVQEMARIVKGARDAVHSLTSDPRGVACLTEIVEWYREDCKEQEEALQSDEFDSNVDDDSDGSWNGPSDDLDFSETEESEDDDDDEPEFEDSEDSGDSGDEMF